MTSVVDQVFDLVFFGTLDQVRWRFREIGAMNGVFLVWQEEGSVEYIMDGPRGGEAQLIRHRGYLFGNAKGAVTFGG